MARKWTWIAAACGALLVAGAVAAVVRMHESSTVGLPQTIPGAGESPGSGAVAVCGVPDLSRVTAAPGGAPKITPTTVAGGLSDQDDAVREFAISGERLGVLQDLDGSARVTLYSTAGARQGQFTLSSRREDHEPVPVDSFVLGPDGAVYVLVSNTLEKLSSSGVRQWATDLTSISAGDVSSAFAWHGPDGSFAVGVGLPNGTVALVDSAGTVAADRPKIAGDIFNPQPDGGLITASSTEGGIYLRRYDADGTQTARFGSVKTAQRVSATGAPFSFRNPLGATTAPNGELLVAEQGTGIIALSRTGMWQGVAPDGSVDSNVQADLHDGSRLISANGRYYFAVDSQKVDNAVDIVYLSEQQMQTWLHMPTELNAAQQSWLSVLGVGAGLTTPAADGYFPSGQAPRVSAHFDPWWASVAGHYSLRYTVRSAPRPDGSQPAQTQTAEIPRGGDIALRLPDRRPGAYQVNAELVQRSTGTAVSGTCLNYSIGAPGNKLDFGSLSPGADWGGPPPLRGVQLAAELGVDSYRYSMDFSSVVPDPSAMPSQDALHWDSLPRADSGKPFAQIAAAAALARQAGVDFIVQVSQGDHSAKAAVRAGSWGAWVTQIVRAFRVNAPDVRDWAPWNEPNDTGFENGADYARRVLAPFSEAVHSVEPAALVLGGNSLGTAPEWWAQLAHAGGCANLDVVSVHPYTGYNRSWEEDGMLGQLAALKRVLAACGAERKPMWDTESAWWSDGPANFWAQGDDVARKLMWMRAVGLARWTYFITEGGFDNGTSYSLIQADHYVKPGALAFMTVTRLLANRPAPRMVSIGIPSSYAMDFGPASGQPTRILAAWTDEFPVTARISAGGGAAVTVIEHDVAGGTTTLHVPAHSSVLVPLSGSPLFFESPTGTALTLSPAAVFGADVLIGGRATATSTAKDSSAASVLREDPDNPNPWQSGPRNGQGRPDLQPSVMVTTAASVLVDRVLVASPSIRCCTPGLRDYTISVRHPDGTWHQVARQRNQFFARTVLFQFPTVTITGVRVDIPSISEKGTRLVDMNYSGAVGGLVPAYLDLQSTSDHAAAISAIAAYAPPR